MQGCDCLEGGYAVLVNSFNQIVCQAREGVVTCRDTVNVLVNSIDAQYAVFHSMYPYTYTYVHMHGEHYGGVLLHRIPGVSQHTSAVSADMS